MYSISVKELREQFGQVKEAVEHGESLLLIYRSRPLAEIRPILENKTHAKNETRSQTNFKLKKVRKLAGGFKLGKQWTPAKLNALYEQSYKPLLP